MHGEGMQLDRGMSDIDCVRRKKVTMRFALRCIDILVDSEGVRSCDGEEAFAGGNLQSALRGFGIETAVRSSDRLLTLRSWIHLHSPLEAVQLADDAHASKF